MKNPAVGAAGVFGITGICAESSNNYALNIGENFRTGKRSLLPER